ncbi:hypothetical protein FS749_005930 [Ceratobasidium sp. UAMH 11750]|nr:hypothetical protein FS749_005930 [Ceratobasidium sp. UAMH 11750]
MDYDSNSGNNSGVGSAPEFSDDDGKILCTCGCVERLSVRQKNRHLKKARQRARKNLSDLGKPELMDVDAGPQAKSLHTQEEDGLEEHMGDGLFDHANDVFMNNPPDDTLSDAPSLTGSWYEVGTPPPTPPPPPSDLSDNDVASDKDGYHHVTAEDYHEYDRWYAEDRQDELDEMVSETLTKKEMDSIKMMAICQFGHISIRNYERIRYSFRNKVRLLTLQRLETRVAALSGVTSLDFDRCVNVCHAFTEKYANETECSDCHAPRYDAKGQPRKVYHGINNSGCENYLISRTDWVAIGRETEASTNLLPSAFIHPLPDIQSSTHLYCGESWSLWLIYIGPIVLRGRLSQKYYDHYLELVAILKCLLQFYNSMCRIEQLREEIAGYVERFEEYYYQYSYDCLCVCKLTLHTLLHVADDVLLCGPVWVYWSFSTERYCHEVVACAKSKVVPYSAINKFLLQMVQLATISARFPEIWTALLFGKGDAPVDTSRMEFVYPEYPDAILRLPRLRGFFLQPNVRHRLAAYFRTNDPRRTFHQWLDFIPERCEQWGKLCIKGGDCIRSASASNPLSPYGRRDTSFVRFTYDKDINTRHRLLPAKMVPAIGYGHLDFILAISLPPDPDFGVEQSQLHILAHLTEAKDAEGDASTELVSYTKLGPSFILDITTLDHVVGRAETRGKKTGGEWVIVDRSSSLCPTVFYQPEEEFEEDEN